MKFYNQEQEEVIKYLNSSKEGLSIEEANKRLNENGKNVLPQKKKESVFSIFISEFKDPMILLLLVAITASLIAGETIDAIAIIFIVLVDVIMGTYQENKANNTAEALSKLVTVKTKVIRDNKEMIIESSELVVGDIILLESGDKISADARIIEEHNLTVDESILTGESINVEKIDNIINKDNIIL